MTHPERLRARRVHGIGYNVQPIAEQMAVLIQRHRRRLVAEHLLHNLDVSAAGYSQSGGRMPECVWVEARNAQRRGCLNSAPAGMSPTSSPRRAGR